MNDRQNTITLSDAELEDFRSWVKERHERYQRLLDKVSPGNSRSGRHDLGHVGAGMNDSAEISNGAATADKVFLVLQSNGNWMSSRQIINELREKHGLTIKRPSLRYHLNNGLKSLYENRGKGGASKWRAIKK